MYHGWWGVQLIRHSRVSRQAGNRRQITEFLIFNRVPEGLSRVAGGRLLLLRRLDQEAPALLPQAHLAG
jgi:hypothetical protein